MPEEELRLMRLQREIENVLAQTPQTQEKKEKEAVKEAPPDVQEVLNVALNNIEVYYRSAGNDRKKIENALNAAESVLGDIRSAKQDGRWDAPNQSDRLWILHKEIREKLKNL